MQKRGIIVIVYLAVLLTGFYAGSYFHYYGSKQEEASALQNSYQSQGWKLYLEGDYDSAVNEFNAYLKKDNENAAAHSGLGWSYYAKGDYAKAIAEFRKAIETDPDNYDNYNGIGWSYYALKDYKSAVVAFKSAVEKNPKVLVLYSGLGRSYYNLKDYGMAEKAFSDALKINPGLVFPNAGLFLVHYENNNIEKAKGELDKIMPFKYDKRLVPDKDYKLFADCMFRLEGKKENLEREAYKCGRMI